MGKRISSLILALVFIVAPVIAEAAYGPSLRSATKVGRVFHTVTWDLKLIWHATFFSDTFRDAYIDRHIKVNYLSPEEAALYREEQERRQADSWQFTIIMYTKSDYKNFTSFEDSFWKILLETESGEVYKPISVDMIPITPYEEVMYPFIDRWSAEYRVTFPKVPLGERFWLTMESVVGKSTLTWRVK